MSRDSVIPWLRKASGAVTLGYVLLHVWFQASALSGRHAYAERAASPMVAGLLGMLGVSALVWFALETLRKGPHGAPSAWSTARKAAVVLVMVFAAAHVVHLIVRDALWSPPQQAYDVLRSDLGRPVLLVLYSFGIGATAFLVPAMGRTFLGDRRFGEHRMVRLGVYLLAIIVWCTASTLLSYHAAGDCFFGCA